MLKQMFDSLLALLIFNGCGSYSVNKLSNSTQISEQTTTDTQWTWIDLITMLCANGSTTGYAHNTYPGASKTLYYLEGGGLCYDKYTCNQQWLSPAQNLNGYTKASFNAHMNSKDASGKTIGSRGIWDRTDPNNPFRDWNYVYIPYCTGDLHMGNRIDDTNPAGALVANRQPSGRYHVGYNNVRAVLNDSYPLYANSTRVVIAGGSAGGFGTIYNFAQVEAKFNPAAIPTVHVSLLNESGPPLDTAYIKMPGGKPGQENYWHDAWGLEQTLPNKNGSKPVSTRLKDVWAWNIATWPTREFGHIGSTADWLLALYLNIGIGDYALALADLRNSVPGGRYFHVNGTAHGYIHNDISTWPSANTFSTYGYNKNLAQWLSEAETGQFLIPGVSKGLALNDPPSP